MNGETSYAGASAFMTSWFGSILLFAWTLCLFYHLCNGIRHLLWDIGLALEIEQAYLAGKIVVAVAVVLTLLAWIV